MPHAPPRLSAGVYWSPVRMDGNLVLYAVNADGDYLAHRSVGPHDDAAALVRELQALIPNYLRGAA